MNPARMIRDLIGAANRWFERAEKEEEDYRRELIEPPVDETVKNDRISSGPGGPTLDLSPRPPQAQTAGTADTKTTQIPAPPPKAPPPPPTADKPGQTGKSTAPRTTGVAGMKSRREAKAAAGVVQNEKNDTVYNERSELAEQIHAHYVRFGDRIAAAVLSRALAPGGMPSMLSKLGLGPSGTTDGDHRNIVSFIDREGLEEFCRRIGLKAEEVAPKKTAPGASGTGTRPSVRRRAGASSPEEKSGASMRLRRSNVKPVTLEKQDIPLGPPPPPPAQPTPVTPVPPADAPPESSAGSNKDHISRLLEDEMESDRFTEG